jgi:hypothetical protein
MRRKNDRHRGGAYEDEVDEAFCSSENVAGLTGVISHEKSPLERFP